MIKNKTSLLEDSNRFFNNYFEKQIFLLSLNPLFLQGFKVFL